MQAANPWWRIDWAKVKHEDIEITDKRNVAIDLSALVLAPRLLEFRLECTSLNLENVDSVTKEQLEGKFREVEFWIDEDIHPHEAGLLKKLGLFRRR